MYKLLDPNSRFGHFIWRCTDLICINIMTLLCSLPIVTFGAAMSAMYYALYMMKREEGGSVIKCFFRSFRINITKGIVLSLIYILFFGILVLDVVLGYGSPNQAFKLVLYAIPTVFLVGASVYSWTFPLLSLFNNSVFTTIKNALAISIAHPWKTLLMIILNALPILLLFLTLRVLLFLLFLGASLPGYLICCLCMDVFKSTEEPSEDEKCKG